MEWLSNREREKWNEGKKSYNLSFSNPLLLLFLSFLSFKTYAWPIFFTQPSLACWWMRRNFFFLHKKEMKFVLLIDWQNIKVDWITNVQFIFLLFLILSIMSHSSSLFAFHFLGSFSIFFFSLQLCLALSLRLWFSLSLTLFILLQFLSTFDVDLGKISSCIHVTSFFS